MSFTTRRSRVTTGSSPKHISSFRSVFVSLFLVSLASLLFGYFWIVSIGSTEIEAGRYNIGKGETLSTLDSILHIDISHNRYKLWLRFFALNRQLEVGTYTVITPVTLDTFIRENLDTPTHTDLTITLLPGWNTYDMDAYFQEKNILGVGVFMETAITDFPMLQKKYRFLEWASSLEGFLLPDTYRVRKDATAHEILEVMLHQFEIKIAPEYLKMDPKKAYETLILASIVEREERNSYEQPIVAGILAKRLVEGMPIGADATVCYGYAKTQSQCTPSFIASVIYDPNPYNTRSTQGLPPTPISSIKVDTWNHTLHSESSEYYYYLHDSDGVIHYGKTLEEHSANKKKYL